MTSARRATTAALAATGLALGACGAVPDGPADPPAATTTLAPTTTDTPAEAPGPVEILVVVGESPARVERVPLGAEVVLRVRNDDVDDEFHLHGYDLGGDGIPAGEEAVWRFTASKAGEFTLESHVTGDVLFTLLVDD